MDGGLFSRIFLIGVLVYEFVVLRDFREGELNVEGNVYVFFRLPGIWRHMEERFQA